MTLRFYLLSAVHRRRLRQGLLVIAASRKAMYTLHAQCHRLDKVDWPHHHQLFPWFHTRYLVLCRHRHYPVICRAGLAGLPLLVLRASRLTSGLDPDRSAIMPRRTLTAWKATTLLLTAMLDLGQLHTVWSPTDVGRGLVKTPASSFHSTVRSSWLMVITFLPRGLV